jgi:hypothetical protein
MMLVLTFGVSMLTLGSGRANAMQRLRLLQFHPYGVELPAATRGSTALTHRFTGAETCSPCG